MTFPLWKKWLSYFTPVLIEDTSSPLNPELTVTLDRGRLQLLAGRAIYSWDDLYRNFRIAFEELDIEERPLQDVLILGLGLGSIPFLLEKNFDHVCRYVAVELDPEIARLAGQYSLPRIHSPVEIVTADAEIFVQICSEQFDLIALDIFEDDLTPPQFETVEFLENCARLLRPGGIVLFNRLYHSLADKTATDRFFKNAFLKVFPGGRVIDTRGNWVLVAEHIKP